MLTHAAAAYRGQAPGPPATGRCRRFLDFGVTPGANIFPQVCSPEFTSWHGMGWSLLSNWYRYPVCSSVTEVRHAYCYLPFRNGTCLYPGNSRAPVGEVA